LTFGGEARKIKVSKAQGMEVLAERWKEDLSLRVTETVAVVLDIILGAKERK